MMDGESLMVFVGFAVAVAAIIIFLTRDEDDSTL